MQHKKEKIRKIIFRGIMITIGSFLAALSIQGFLVPNGIIDGGVIGVSLILNTVLGDVSPIFSFGVLVVLLNLPFMYSGYKQIGKTFVLSSLYGIIMLSVFETAMHGLHGFTEEPILAVVFGGLVLGVGVGLVIRYGGALDGTEIFGIIMTKKMPFSVGEVVMVINVFIFSVAAFVYGYENAMYSVMMYYLAFKTIDTVTQGLDETKAVFIVSDNHEELSAAIQARLGRGTTLIRARGGYALQEKDMIYCIVNRLEVTKLKNVVYDIDEAAFVTIMNTQETRGGKFKSAIH